MAKKPSVRTVIQNLDLLPTLSQTRAIMKKAEHLLHEEVVSRSPDPEDPDYKEVHYYFYENSTGGPHVRISKLRISRFRNGQEGINSLMEKVAALCEKELPANSWKIGTRDHVFCAPMCGCYTSTLKNNALTIFYRSHSG